MSFLNYRIDKKLGGFPLTAHIFNFKPNDKNLVYCAMMMMQEFVDEHLICANPMESALSKTPYMLYEYQYTNEIRRNCPYFPTKNNKKNVDFITLDDLNEQFRESRSASHNATSPICIKID
tara:strand:+ start:147 stop:509 length:363 start_codon:yes stop_codon:yes gene_type:complete